MGKNAAKGKGGGRSKRRKTNESNGWLNVGDRTIITFRVDGVKFLYPAVVASVETKTTTLPGGLPGDADLRNDGEVCRHFETTPECG